MAFNGAGVYVLASGNPVVTGTVISSTWANTTLGDIASGLTTCLTKDGQSTPTGNIKLGGFKLTNLGAGSSAGDALRYQQLFTTGNVNLLGAINSVKTTVASATTPDIWTNCGNIIDYTGTATATGFAAAPQAGASRTLICAGAAVFTAGANLIIPGVASGSSLTMSANTLLYVVAFTTTQFILVAPPQDHPSAAKGWVSFSVAAAITAAYNVTSITDNATGDFTVNWTVPFSGNEYSVQGSLCVDHTPASRQINLTTRVAASQRLITYFTSDLVGGATLSEANINRIDVVAYGGQ